MGPNLCAGRLCDRKKLVELRGTVSLKTLGNIGHDRNRRPSNLIPKSKIFRKGPASSTRIDLTVEDPGFLPGQKVLKSIYTSFFFPFTHTSTEHAVTQESPQPITPLASPTILSVQTSLS